MLFSEGRHAQESVFLGQVGAYADSSSCASPNQEHLFAVVRITVHLWLGSGK